MASEKPSNVIAGRLNEPRRTIAHLRANAARMVGDANPIAAVNDVVLAATKAGSRYRNGVTLPAGAQRLLADARRKDLRHSSILARNMAAAGASRPAHAAAHHIVAHGDARAFPAQDLLFGWGIAINDADNGVYLPRFRSSVIDGAPHALKHATLHTGFYHLEVYARLVDIAPEREHSESGRAALRGIKAELSAGTFPYRPEDDA